MTKALPYGCIKKREPPTFTEFHRILDGIWWNDVHEDTIGDLFIVDIKFSNINSKTFWLNELCPPIFEKIKE